jgi:hypothetical protein
VRGGLPPEIAGYTWRVTQAWCGYFAGTVLASAALFLFAPLPVWSLFVNSQPAADGGDVRGEYLVRITRFRHLRHFPITAAARALGRRARLPPGCLAVADTAVRRALRRPEAGRGNDRAAERARARCAA